MVAMTQLGALNRQAGIGDGALVRRNCKTKTDRRRRGSSESGGKVDEKSDSDRSVTVVLKGRWKKGSHSPPTTAATSSTTTTTAPPSSAPSSNNTSQLTFPTNTIQKLVSRPKKRTSENICRDGASSPEDRRAPKTKSRTSHARKLGKTAAAPRTPPQGWVPSPTPPEKGVPTSGREIREAGQDEMHRPGPADDGTWQAQLSSASMYSATESTSSLSESLSSIVTSSTTQTVTPTPPEGPPSSVCGSSRDSIDLGTTTTTATTASSPLHHHGGYPFAPPVPLTQDTLQKVAMGRAKRPSSRSTWSTVSSRNGSECHFSVATSRTALSEFDDSATDTMSVTSRAEHDFVGGGGGFSRSLHRHSAPQGGYFRAADHCGGGGGGWPSHPPSAQFFRGGGDSESLSPGHENVDFEARCRSDAGTPLDRRDSSADMMRRSRSQEPDAGIKRSGSDKTGYRPRLHGRLPNRTPGVRRSSSDRTVSVPSARSSHGRCSSVASGDDQTTAAASSMAANRLSLPDPSALVKRSASDRAAPRLNVVEAGTRRTASERSRVNPLRDGQVHATIPVAAWSTTRVETSALNSPPTNRGSSRPAGAGDNTFRHSVPTLPSMDARMISTIIEDPTGKLGDHMQQQQMTTRPSSSLGLTGHRRDAMPVQFDAASGPTMSLAEYQFYMATASSSRVAAASPGLDSIAESCSSADQSGGPKLLRRKAGSRRLREDRTPPGGGGGISSGASSGSTLSLPSSAPSPSSVGRPSSLDDMDESFLSAGESADCDMLSLIDGKNNNGGGSATQQDQLQQQQQTRRRRLPPDDPFLPLVGLAAQELLRQFRAWRFREAKGSSTSSKPTRSAAKKEGGVRKSAATKRRVSSSDSPVSDENEGDGDDEDGGGSPPKKTSKKARTCDGPARRLACPFWKKDPDNHFACYRKTLSRIKYVKQHLYKCHQAPIHCFSCGDVFSDEQRLADHSRRRECRNRDDFAHEGLSRAQVDQISRRADPNLSEQDQWFALWDIIFPDPNEPRPQSAYIDNELSEDLCNFREFLEAEGAHSLQHYMRQLNPDNNNNNQHHRGGVGGSGDDADADEDEDEAAVAARERIVYARVLDALYNEWLARRRARIRGRIHTTTATTTIAAATTATPAAYARSQSLTDSPVESPELLELADPERGLEPGPTLVLDDPHVLDTGDPNVWFGYSSADSDYHVVNPSNLDRSLHGHDY